MRCFLLYLRVRKQSVGGLAHRYGCVFQVRAVVWRGAEGMCSKESIEAGCWLVGVSLPATANPSCARLVLNRGSNTISSSSFRLPTV